MEKQKPRIGLMFLILGLLFLFSLIMAAIISGSEENYKEYNTAIISINGVITTDRSSGLFTTDSASSADIVFHWSYLMLSIRMKKRGLFLSIRGKIF